MLFLFSPPKISWVVSGIKYICLHSLTVFYLIQPSSNQIICFDFRKQNSVLPIVFHVPWKDLYIKTSQNETVIDMLDMLDIQTHITIWRTLGLYLLAFKLFASGSFSASIKKDLRYHYRNLCYVTYSTTSLNDSNQDSRQVFL